MTKDEVLKLALEKFEFMNHVDSIFEGEFDFQINAIKEALMSVPDGAQPSVSVEQEPVEVFLTDEHQMGFKVGVQSFILDYWPDEQAELEFMKAQLLTAFARAKAQRKPLTDEEIERNWQFLYDEEGNPPDHHDFARAIEAEHGIKG